MGEEVVSVSIAATGNGPWIRSARWDLTWLVGSVLVVPIAPLLWKLGLTADHVAMVVLFAVGGPHVFVTFTRTLLSRQFVREYPAYSRLAYLVPIATAAFAFGHKELFLTVFFTWASLHVLQQIIYVGNAYTNRMDSAPGKLERLVEYGVVLSALYPFATIRMVEGTFALDGTRLLVPEFLLGTGLIVTAFTVFGIFVLAWLGFTARRAVRGELHYGKTLLIAATVAGTCFTPLFPNLDVAFQGINSWHCIQYLALIWLTNRRRMEAGGVQNGFVRRLSGDGSRGFFSYYAAAVTFTLVMAGVIFALQHLLAVSFLLAYYMLGKGILLMHYYFDSFLFTRNDEITVPGFAGRPVPAPAGAGRLAAD
jgi:hypothetical protein